MSDMPIVVADPQTSRDNEARPFHIEGMEVRGRAVRLGTTVDQILSAHNYPESVSQFLGHLLVLTALLGSVLKHKGIITLQIKATGLLKMAVADVQLTPGEPGALRGYAQLSSDHAGMIAAGNASFRDLMGKEKGYLAITIDQGEDMDRYQGIVELAGDRLEDVAKNYFLNSEQLPTALELACERDNRTGRWRAGGIMVQNMARREEGAQRILTGQSAEQWNRASILMSSVKHQELLDPMLNLDTLLFRLFHEDGVRVFEAMHLVRGCRCSLERLESIISQFSKDDIDHMTVDGVIAMTCEFCNKTFKFTPPSADDHLSC